MSRGGVENAEKSQENAHFPPLRLGVSAGHHFLSEEFCLTHPLHGCETNFFDELNCGALLIETCLGTPKNLKNSRYPHSSGPLGFGRSSGSCVHWQKRQRTAAVQNLADFLGRIPSRDSVVDCGSPLPLWVGTRMDLKAQGELPWIRGGRLIPLFCGPLKAFEEFCLTPRGKGANSAN